MTRRLAVPRHAPLEQHIICDAEEVANAAMEAPAAHAATSSALSNHLQISSQAHDAVHMAQAGLQNTAQSETRHASMPEAAASRPGRDEVQQRVKCGQTEHHISFRQKPEQLEKAVRKRPAPASNTVGPNNPFQQYIYSDAGKQAFTPQNFQDWTEMSGTKGSEFVCTVQHLAARYCMTTCRSNLVSPQNGVHQCVPLCKAGDQGKGLSPQADKAREPLRETIRFKARKLQGEVAPRTT